MAGSEKQNELLRFFLPLAPPLKVARLPTAFVAAGDCDPRRHWRLARPSGANGKRQEKDFAAESRVPPLDPSLDADDAPAVRRDERRPTEPVRDGDRSTGLGIPDSRLVVAEPDHLPATVCEPHSENRFVQAGERAYLLAGRGVPHNDVLVLGSGESAAVGAEGHTDLPGQGPFKLPVRDAPDLDLGNGWAW